MFKLILTVFSELVILYCIFCFSFVVGWWMVIVGFLCLCLFFEMKKTIKIARIGWKRLKYFSGWGSSAFPQPNFLCGSFPFQKYRWLHLSLLSFTEKKKRKRKKNGGLRDAGGLQGKMEKIEAIPEATGNGIAHQSNVL